MVTGEYQAAVRDVPRIVASRIASGDATGAGQLLYRVLENDWGFRTTLATLELLNRLVSSAGCSPPVRAAFAGVRRAPACTGVALWHGSHEGR